MSQTSDEADFWTGHDRIMISMAGAGIRKAPAVYERTDETPASRLFQRYYPPVIKKEFLNVII